VVAQQIISAFIVQYRIDDAKGHHLKRAALEHQFGDLVDGGSLQSRQIGKRYTMPRG
jgi:hypothetical protein